MFLMSHPFLVDMKGERGPGFQGVFVLLVKTLYRMVGSVFLSFSKSLRYVVGD